MDHAYCSNAITPRAHAHNRVSIHAWMNAMQGFWASLKIARRAKASEWDLTALDGLSVETLKDIGAPEWVHERFQRSENRAHEGGLFERDPLNWR